MLIGSRFVIRLIGGLEFQEFLVAFLLILFCAALLIFLIVNYRCPRCNEIPISGKPMTGGVLWFPRKCWNCDAPLMPNHPFSSE
jgi:hypothetical protein